MCVFYSLFDSLRYNTQRYIASCVVFLRARRGDEKFEQFGCLYYMLNHRIMDLLRHYYFCFLNFTLRNTSYGPICASYRCFKEYAKDKNNTNENLSLKSSFLKNSSLKGKKKLKFGFFCAAFLLLFIFALFYILIQRRILRLNMTLFSKIT